ncbi:hypothetical protein J8273_0690 [Carpediemonas membranifera]|uniref:Uncharacterized protein n=1 Tax=Carpediemonas membranifera TaxID=201153 RepID=A0A8J6B3I3_9EUKA|nr:hypothetical protein J8273_0690 [Carpediemonas membranifera]|eukprot:KAG9397560.1 hypothetical protein J8273_0690 [Carpediemonas membranifera]
MTDCSSSPSGRCLCMMLDFFLSTLSGTYPWLHLRCKSSRRSTGCCRTSRTTSPSSLWAFSTQHTINDPDKRVVSVIVADDTDNDVTAVTYTYGQGTGADQQIVSESFLADSDLNKIDGTESIFSYAVADYPCVATGECWTTRFQVEKGSYMIKNKTLTTTDNVTSSKTIVTWQFDDVLESGAVWVRIGILAVVLALAVVA